MSNLALAHKQCNQLKGSSPHPRTVYDADGWRCQRCQEAVSRGADQHDWHWNRPIVEHVVPLDSPEIWWYGRCWTCHLRCHAYHLPIPPLVLAHSNVVPHAGSHCQADVVLVTLNNARASIPQ
jgi:hypothetical protein